MNKESKPNIKWYYHLRIWLAQHVLGKRIVLYRTILKVDGKRAIRDEIYIDKGAI